ncbi:sigma-70 family RNA polymerase sigma factor [Paenibacillus terrigena]|uniref:sigma-70 family RNA polymerase sigma factor n=1 Tax=Paenibacillus terrigena TaxID=369333 RepID=UPI0028D04B45|nr:sigma-70 family RNA polymerase sigma factor [Paenibacillus terrigena]
MQEIELQPWIERLREGDQSAFQVIYEWTFPEIYRSVVFLIPDKQEIEDLMNEIYFQLWKSIPNYDSRRPFRFWLHGIVLKQIQKWRTQRWRRFRIFEKKRLLEVEEHLFSDRPVLAAETHQEMLSVVHQLSYKLRIVIILRYYHDYAFDEIAELLDIPLGTVKSRHHSALGKLRELSPHFEQEKEQKLYVH